MSSNGYWVNQPQQQRREPTNAERRNYAVQRADANMAGWSATAVWAVYSVASFMADVLIQSIFRIPNGSFSGWVTVVWMVLAWWFWYAALRPRFMRAMGH
jgi:hypothetical protein